MRLTSFYLPRWRSVIALLLLVGIVLNAYLVLEASAAIRVCRGDPVMWLSNGTKITLVATIAADASEVKMVSYTVHAPRGLATRQIVYTGGALTNKERVNVLFDRTSGYQVEVLTDLGATVASVTVDATVGNTTRTLTAPSTSKISFVFP